MHIIPVPSNRPSDRFYPVARKITDFRGEPLAGDREPEDWVASTTTVAGEGGHAGGHRGCACC